MRSELPSVVDRFAAFAVAQVREGGKLFGRTFVRQGPLFTAAGWWLFQTSGAFGYGLREQPAIMGKLLGVPGENAANYVQTTLSEVASEQLRYAADKERTFLHLYLVPTLADYGIDFYELPSGSGDWISEKIYDQQAIFDFMQIVFQKGAAVSFHFPKAFCAYWDETFRRRDDSEWADMYKIGIVPREQQALRLDDEVWVALEAAVDWVRERAPSTANAPGVTYPGGSCGRHQCDLADKASVPGGE